MKILHTNDSGGMYGKEQVILTLVRKQVEHGHEVTVAGFGDDAFFYEASNIANGGFTLYRNISDFRKQLPHFNQYDVIHTHDFKTGVLLAARHLYNIHTPVIRTVHGYTGFGKPFYSKIKLYEYVDRIMHLFNTQTVAVSPDLASMLGATLIHNGIDPVEIDRENLSLRADIVDFCTEPVDDMPIDSTFVFGTMARLSHEKNLDVLIDAISMTKGAKLLLFGDGYLRYELEERAQQYPGKVFFAGFESNPTDYLSLFDCYIQPSLTEGMPISVLEAMSVGIPLMVSHVGGMKILHDENAAVDSSTTPNFMAARMRSFISHNVRRDDMVKNATALFNDKFSADAMYEAYLKLYTTTKDVVEENE